MSVLTGKSQLHIPLFSFNLLCLFSLLKCLNEIFCCEFKDDKEEKRERSW